MNMTLESRFRSPVLIGLITGAVMIPILILVDLSLNALVGWDQTPSPEIMLMMVSMFGTWGYFLKARKPSASKPDVLLMAMGLYTVVHLLGIVPTTLVAGSELQVLLTLTPVGAACTAFMVFLSTVMRVAGQD